MEQNGEKMPDQPIATYIPHKCIEGISHVEIFSPNEKYKFAQIVKRIMYVQYIIIYVNGF